MNQTAFPNHPDYSPGDNVFGSDQQNSWNQGGNNNGGGNQGNQQNRGNWNNNNRQGNGGNGGQGGNNQGGFQKKPWNGQRQGGNSNWKQNQPMDLSFYKPYAVTGNPNPPDEILRKIERIVQKLDALEYTTRTGGMQGVEESAERSAKKLELLLPWRGFSDKESKLTFTNERAVFVAKKFSSAYDGLKPAAQAFLAKNVRLVMGQQVNSPALFLIVWTEDGAEKASERNSRTGFAGHPISIANALGIPVFNLGKADAEERLNRYLETIAA